MSRACSSLRAKLGAAATLAAWLLASIHRADAAPAPRAGLPAEPVFTENFRALAQQRPRPCGAASTPAVPLTGWTSQGPQCAWRNLLQMQSWQGPALGHGKTCISAAAAWWYWAGAAQPARVWQAGWRAHSAQDDTGSGKRLVLLRETAAGTWSMTEWRWTPSARADTRAWQQRRWQLLVQQAAQFSQPRAADHSATDLLWQTLEQQVSDRPAERHGDVLKWQSNGLCLKVDAAAPGAQQLQLPYSADDSRLEQRSAMQLQLARRYPGARWLMPFTLIANPRPVHGGAKFMAVWTDAGRVKGQLWMPSKNNGPLVRVRITTDLPVLAEAPGQHPALQLRQQVIERELLALAARWKGHDD